MEIFWGKVIPGAKRGRTLGFPTANIAVHMDIAEGIYVAKIKHNTSWHNALTFIGKAITFGAKKIYAETYVLDFSENLYGKYITIQLVEKLRENKKFDSVEDLIKQMKQDEVAAREFFKKKIRP